MPFLNSLKKIQNRIFLDPKTILIFHWLYFNLSLDCSHFVYKEYYLHHGSIFDTENRMCNYNILIEASNLLRRNHMRSPMTPFMVGFWIKCLLMLESRFLRIKKPASNTTMVNQPYNRSCYFYVDLKTCYNRTYSRNIHSTILLTLVLY